LEQLRQDNGTGPRAGSNQGNDNPKYHCASSRQGRRAIHTGGGQHIDGLQCGATCSATALPPSHSRSAERRTLFIRELNFLNFQRSLYLRQHIG
jgi:hypothetical protein